MLANLIERTCGVLTGGPAPQPVAPTANDTYRAARAKLDAARAQLEQVQAKLPELATDRDRAFAALAGASEVRAAALRDAVLGKLDRTEVDAVEAKFQAVRAAADTAEALLKAAKDADTELRAKIENQWKDTSREEEGMEVALRTARKQAASEEFFRLAGEIADKLKPLAPDLARLYALGRESGDVCWVNAGPPIFSGGRQIHLEEHRWLTVFAAVTQPPSEEEIDALAADDAALGIG